MELPSYSPGSLSSSQESVHQPLAQNTAKPTTQKAPASFSDEKSSSPWRQSSILFLQISALPTLCSVCRNSSDLILGIGLRKDHPLR